jgi:guanylate kinase
MKPEQEKRIIVISAPSGTGKSTIIKKLMEKHDNLKFSVSTTTRKPRPGEVEGVDYHFVDEKEFLKMREQNEFLEWARVHQNYYGTTKGAVKNILKKGNYCVLDIDVQGALQVLQIYPNSRRIFLLPPSIPELKCRLEKRGDTEMEAIQVRLENALKELTFISYYHYFVVNEDIDRTVEKMEQIIYG